LEPKLCLVAFAAAVLFPELEGAPSYLILCIIGARLHLVTLSLVYLLEIKSGPRLIEGHFSNISSIAIDNYVH
jgi:hypothetical protein